MKILTTHDPKPIPLRSFDWSATTDNYDVSYEGPEDGGWVANEPVGYGATEEAAIADLKEQLAEDDERYMCTCHGIDRVGDACIENCGKVRL